MHCKYLLVYIEAVRPKPQVGELETADDKSQSGQGGSGLSLRHRWPFPSVRVSRHGSVAAHFPPEVPPPRALCNMLSIHPSKWPPREHFCRVLSHRKCTPNAPWRRKIGHIFGAPPPPPRSKHLRVVASLLIATYPSHTCQSAPFRIKNLAAFRLKVLRM